MSNPNIYIPLIGWNKNDHFDMSLFKCQNQSGAGISSASHDKSLFFLFLFSKMSDVSCHFRRQSRDIMMTYSCRS